MGRWQQTAEAVAPWTGRRQMPEIAGRKGMRYIHERIVAAGSGINRRTAGKMTSAVLEAGRCLV